MKTIKSLFALCIIVIIPFGIMLRIRVHQSSGFASQELILYPLLFGGGSILILYALKRFFLKENISDFDPGKGNWGTDIVWGLLLTGTYFFLMYVERLTLANYLTFIPNHELLGLMLDMREDPLLTVLWFGPVLWVGIALYEELIRIFMLTTLWRFNSGVLWTISTIFITSAIVGLSHWSQGSYGVVTIALKSIIACFFFYKNKRLFPLVLAHVLYDGIQVAMLLLSYPR